MNGEYTLRVGLERDANVAMSKPVTIEGLLRQADEIFLRSKSSNTSIRLSDHHVPVIRMGSSVQSSAH